MLTLIETDEDFINSKKYGYSLKNLLQRYPEGVPPNIIASCLMIEESDVEAVYDAIVAKLRALMGVSD